MQEISEVPLRRGLFINAKMLNLLKFSCHLLSRLCLGGVFLWGCVPCASLNLKEYKETRAYFGTNVTIRCFSGPKDISPIIKKCWDKLELMQQEMNAYSEAGDLARINKFGFNGVAVHNETFRILKDALGFFPL